MSGWAVKFGTGVLAGAAGAAGAFMFAPALSGGEPEAEVVEHTLTLFNVEAGEAETVVARAGPVVITDGDVKTMFAELDPAAAEALKENDEALSNALETVLKRQSMAAEAMADESWEGRDAAILQARNTALQTIMRAYVASSASDAPVPTEDNLRQVYAANEGAFLTQTRHRFAQIYLGVSPEAALEGQQAVEEEIFSLYEEAVRPRTDFAALASEHSQHAETAGQGGETGWVLENQLIPELRAALPQLDIGEISRPIRSANGWHVVKYLERDEPRPATYEESREAIATLLTGQAAKDQATRFAAEVAGRHPVDIDAEALAQALADEGAS